MPRAVCTRCGAIHGPLAASCRSCGTPLGADPTPHGGCPRCNGALESVAVEGDTAVRVCRACTGVFVGARAWCTLRRRPDLAQTLASRLFGVKPSGGAVMPMIRCPVCRVEMDRARFAATSTTVIDACPHGHGLWLDAGELADVVAYAEHRAAVGATAARREAEVAERNATGWDPERARLESEVLRMQARAATDQWNAKRASLVLVAVILVLRGAWFFVQVHEAKVRTQSMQEQIGTLPVSSIR